MAPPGTILLWLGDAGMALYIAIGFTFRLTKRSLVHLGEGHGASQEARCKAGAAKLVAHADRYGIHVHKTPDGKVHFAIPVLWETGNRNLVTIGINKFVARANGAHEEAKSFAAHLEKLGVVSPAPIPRLMVMKNRLKRRSRL